MRAKTSFSCQACGHQSPRWLGRCPDCSGWNTMKEERQAPTGKGRPAAMKMAQAKATPIAEIEVVGEDRRLTQIGEFDRVLGGGVIPGSVILIGGDPGIGKTSHDCLQRKNQCCMSLEKSLQGRSRCGGSGSASSIRIS
jgi:DNA repair protein RadA/Sms